jgi:hypothetical protein
MAVDGIASRPGHCACGLCVIFTIAGVEDGAGGIDDQAAAARRAPSAYSRFDVTALCSDARYKQRHVAGQGSDAGDLAGEGGADNQGALTIDIPLRAYQTGNSLVKPFAADLEKLQITATRVRCPAKDDDALVAVGQVGSHRVVSHVGVDRDRIGLEAFESLDRILFGGAADVAALGIKDHGRSRMLAVDMFNQCFELIFRAARGEIRYLGFEAADEVCRGVDNGCAELENGIRLAFEVAREAVRVGIETNAKQAVALAPSRVQGMDEVHGYSRCCKGIILRGIRIDGLASAVDRACVFQENAN